MHLRNIGAENRVKENMEEKEHSVLKRLPYNGERVMCYGHKTYCCQEDMEDEADWYEVIFELIMCSYKFKEEMPEDPEESVLARYKVSEFWGMDSEPMHVIGVTKWKYKD